MLEFLKKLHNEAMRLLSQVKFDKRVEQDRLVVSLYMSMMEQAGSIILLVDRLKEAGVSAIFRSMLEAYVDLKNLTNDAGYVDHLNAKYYGEWLKLMRAGRNSDNAFLAGLKDETEFDKHFGEMEAKLADLIKRKRGPLDGFRNSRWQASKMCIGRTTTCFAPMHTTTSALSSTAT
ncbi:MAG TPA: DUF5677 domain-containing protein [Pseudaminobacter sp.]|nr:DUF5677 domain-containing protein [Pseudaminobacter sp.]